MIFMLTTRISLPENIRMRSAAALNRHLAAALDLRAQVKQAHWNVRGCHFISLHELFDVLPSDVEEWSDLLAERAGVLGGVAHATIQVAAFGSYLSHAELGIATEETYRVALIDALATFITRASIGAVSGDGDPVTANILTEITWAADQALWKLEAHQDLLKGGESNK